MNLSAFFILVIHQIKLGSNRIEWHDISEVFIVSESTGSRLVQKMGFSGKLILAFFSFRSFLLKVSS